MNNHETSAPHPHHHHLASSLTPLTSSTHPLQSLSSKRCPQSNGCGFECGTITGSRLPKASSTHSVYMLGGLVPNDKLFVGSMSTGGVSPPSVASRCKGVRSSSLSAGVSSSWDMMYATSSPCSPGMGWLVFKMLT
mmetsp:Transcript_6709/g.16139  ORF Transcript_6709/g.16139 Transcript_6709/m.16139 type:complete len:136 (-) Transcript_6709:1960-2367(-)